MNSLLFLLLTMVGQEIPQEKNIFNQFQTEIVQSEKVFSSLPPKETAVEVQEEKPIPGMITVYDKNGQKMQYWNDYRLPHAINQWNDRLPNKNVMFDRWGAQWQHADSEYLARWISSRNAQNPPVNLPTQPIQSRPVYQYQQTFTGG